MNWAMSAPRLMPPGVRKGGIMNKGAVGIIAVGLALGLLVLVTAKGEANGTKFKVGDQITGKPVLPTNVIYIIKGINLTDGLYYMAQLINGEEWYPDYYSIAVIDANYVLA